MMENEKYFLIHDCYGDGEFTEFSTKQSLIDSMNAYPNLENIIIIKGKVVSPIIVETIKTIDIE